MTSSSPLLVLVVIAGPQAAGKSAVATALASDLRDQGERVALVELDQIAAMALPTLPDWDTASRIFETVVGQWTRADLTCVIAEGVGSAAEVTKLLARAPNPPVAVTVVVTTRFNIAFARAQADPTRGISREHDFLSRRYDHWPAEMARIPADVQIDTGETSIDRSVAVICSAIASARLEQTSSVSVRSSRAARREGPPRRPDPSDDVAGRDSRSESSP